MSKDTETLFEGLGSEFEAEGGEAAIARHDHTPPPDRQSGVGYAIQSLGLRNYKGFEKFEISLGGFNVLVGANNSGKSTVLRAIRFAYELTKMHFDRVRDGHAVFWKGRSVPKSLLPVAQLRDLWTNGRLREGNRWIPCQLSLTLTSGYRLGYGIIGPWNAATSRIDDDMLASMNAIPGEVVEALLARPPELVPASIGIVAEEEYRTPARRSALVATGRHNEIVRNYLLDLEDEQRDYLSGLLGKYFNADIGDVAFDPDRDQFVSAVYSAGDYKHDLFSAGGGFLQIAEVLAFILRGSPGVVLLDEPDSHLHSSLQHALVDTLEELGSARNFQVIMATHSKEIINYVDPSRLIPLDRGIERASPLAAHTSTVTLLKELGALDNVDAYQVVKQRALLVVEGPTDRELIPRMAAKVGSSLFEGSSRICIIPANGVERLADETELAILEEVLGGPVRCLLLRDRDGLTEDWALRIEKASQRPMVIWCRDSLENYLIVAAAIHRIIVAQLGSDSAPSEVAIQQLIDEIVISLRDATVDRIAARLQDVEWRYNKQRIDAATANPQARAELDRVWENPSARLGIVAGKAVLKRLRTAIQERWGVSFGNARIIEAMTLDEVHGDVCRFLENATQILV